MIEIHYSAYGIMSIEAISKMLSITKNGPPDSRVCWRVDFIDTKSHEVYCYLYGNGLNDGLKLDNEFHGPDDEDWEAWVAKYSHNLEVEQALEKL